MTSLRILKPAFVLALLVAFAAIAPARAETAGDARALVQNLADKALAVLADRKAPLAQREATFRKLFNENFHVRSIGVFVLGRHWRSASPAQRKAYLEAFEVFIVKTYSVRLGSYANEKFTITKAAGPDGSGVYIVDSKVTAPNKSPIPLSWTVRRAKAGLRIVDIVIENLSMTQTQRDDFAAILNKEGSIDGLIVALKAKSAALDKE